MGRQSELACHSRGFRGLEGRLFWAMTPGKILTIPDDIPDEVVKVLRREKIDTGMSKQGAEWRAVRRRQEGAHETDLRAVGMQGEWSRARQAGMAR